MRRETTSSLFIPLEIKSTSTLPEEPRQSHYYQLSTYLLAQDYPLGVLLYWAKREGRVKAFTIPKDEVMNVVLRERVFELHDALKKGDLPHKEAAALRDYGQCERCSYVERCNPYLIDSIPKNSKIALFDLDSAVLDTSQKKRMIMQELGLPTSTRSSDIHDEEVKKKYWELIDSPRFVEQDSVHCSGARKDLRATKTRSSTNRNLICSTRSSTRSDSRSGWQIWVYRYSTDPPRAWKL